jgi:hypothetical protein
MTLENIIATKRQSCQTNVDEPQRGRRGGRFASGKQGSGSDSVNSCRLLPRNEDRRRRRKEQASERNNGRGRHEPNAKTVTKHPMTKRHELGGGALRRRSQERENGEASDDPSQFCSVSTFATPSNAVEGTPPVLGLLFTVTPFIDAELVALQLDLVDGADATGSDLHANVYMLVGEFLLSDSRRKYDNDPSHWTPIFDSVGVIIPAPPKQTTSSDGQEDPTSASATADTLSVMDPSRLLLPAQSFTPTLLQSGVTYSFYVTMNGHYLNCVAAALQKTGEVAAQTDDMSVSVGAGLNATGFPETIDPLIDPQFSGILHYRKVKPPQNGEGAVDSICASRTTIAFDYIMNRELPVENDSAFSLAVENAMAEFVGASESLQDFASQGRWLTIVEGGTATQTARHIYTGQCPTSWTSKDCPNLSYRTQLTIAHADDWEEARVRNELYLGHEFVTRALQRTRFTVGLGAALEISYIGQRSIESRLDMTLHLNQSLSSPLSSDQQEFVEHATASFLRASVDPTFVDNLYVNFTSSVSRRDLQQSGVDDRTLLRLSGVIQGTRYEYFGYEEFSQTLQEAFLDVDHNAKFIDALERELLMPGTILLSIQESRPIEGIQGVDVEIEPATGFAVATTTDSKGSPETAVLVGSIMSVFLFLIIVVSTCLFVYKRRKSGAKKLEAERQDKSSKENSRHGPPRSPAQGRVQTPSGSTKPQNMKSASRDQASGEQTHGGVGPTQSPQWSKATKAAVSLTTSPTRGGSTSRSPRRCSSFVGGASQTPSTPNSLRRTTSDTLSPLRERRDSPTAAQPTRTLPAAPLTSPRGGKNVDRVPTSPKSPRRTKSDNLRLSAIGEGGKASPLLPRLPKESPRSPQRSKSFNPNSPLSRSASSREATPRPPQRAASYNQSPRSNTKGTVIGSLPLRKPPESPRSPRNVLERPLVVD